MLYKTSWSDPPEALSVTAAATAAAADTDNVTSCAFGALEFAYSEAVSVAPNAPSNSLNL